MCIYNEKLYEYSKLQIMHKKSACTRSTFQSTYDKQKCLDEYCIKELFNRLKKYPFIKQENLRRYKARKSRDGQALPPLQIIWSFLDRKILFSAIQPELIKQTIKSGGSTNIPFHTIGKSLMAFNSAT